MYSKPKNRMCCAPADTETENIPARQNRIRLTYAHVLIVDDNITNLDVAKGLMKPYGMKIDCVTSGRAAVEAICQEKVIYNAIFMDHMMPEMDGIEATRIIREEIGTAYAQTIPIIALTANAVENSEAMFLSSGFQGFISKPINLKHLDEVLRRFVRDKDLEALEDDALINAGGRGGRAQGIPDRTGADLALLSDHLEGVDIAQGIACYGDIHSFLQILSSYALNTEPTLEPLEDLRPEGLAGYVTAMHGLKGASGNICANALAKRAEALELAAKAGNLELVRQRHPAFAKAVRKLIGSIEAALAEMAEKYPKPKKEIPETRQLRALYEACKHYDFVRIDTVMEEMGHYTYTDDDGLAAWLRENVMRMRWDVIEERLASLLQAESLGDRHG